MPAVLGAFSCTCTMFSCALLSRDSGNLTKYVQDALSTGLLYFVSALSCMTGGL